MCTQYLALIDGRDSEKFRKFTTGQFNNKTKKYLDKNNLSFVWGFHSACVLDSWEQIQTNDQMFFSILSENFRYVSRVVKKSCNSDLGKILWPDDLSVDKITHFLFFNRLEKINLPYIQTMSKSIDDYTMQFSGIYALKTNAVITYDTVSDTKLQIGHSKPLDLHFGHTGRAAKESFEVTRFVRDSSKVKYLKNLYGNKCQICGFTFEFKKECLYSEVHHYNPLHANADDDIDNMIVVCPNHHAQFDYNVIAIDHDGTSIINRNGEKISEIHFMDGHKLNSKNIKSRLTGD